MSWAFLAVYPYSRNQVRNQVITRCRGWAYQSRYDRWQTKDEAISRYGDAEVDNDAEVNLSPV